MHTHRVVATNILLSPIIQLNSVFSSSSSSFWNTFLFTCYCIIHCFMCALDEMLYNLLVDFISSSFGSLCVYSYSSLRIFKTSTTSCSLICCCYTSSCYRSALSFYLCRFIHLILIIFFVSVAMRSYCFQCNLFLGSRNFSCSLINDCFMCAKNDVKCLIKTIIGTCCVLCMCLCLCLCVRAYVYLYENSHRMGFYVFQSNIHIFLFLPILSLSAHNSRSRSSSSSFSFIVVFFYSLFCFVVVVCCRVFFVHIIYILFEITFWKLIIHIDKTIHCKIYISINFAWWRTFCKNLCFILVKGCNNDGKITHAHHRSYAHTWSLDIENRISFNIFFLIFTVLILLLNSILYCHGNENFEERQRKSCHLSAKQLINCDNFVHPTLTR